MEYPKSFAAIHNKVEAEITPFGQYLILKDTPTSVQPFALTDIGLIALFIVGWALKEYIKAFIQASAEKAANDDLKKRLSELANAQTQLEWRLHSVEADTEKLLELLSQLKEVSEVPEIYVAHDVVGPDSLLGLLADLGLTQRAAKRCARDLHSILNKDLARMLRE